MNVGIKWDGANSDILPQLPTNVCSILGHKALKSMNILLWHIQLNWFKRIVSAV